MKFPANDSLKNTQESSGTHKSVKSAYNATSSSKIFPTLTSTHLASYTSHHALTSTLGLKQKLVKTNKHTIREVRLAHFWVSIQVKVGSK